MNKLMLSAAAVALTFAMTPAFAADDAGVKLSLGGFFKGYVNYTNEDNVHALDIIRSTEVHFGGETTLDNGLTVGAMIEASTDGIDGFEVDESYIYMAGSWGRVNFGDEDGAAYLLQVAAPSANSSIDGVRASFNTSSTISQIDYDNDFARNNDKVTYLSPVFSGFQAGVSYTPDNAGATTGGNKANNVAGVQSDIFELAARYEGQISNVGVILGAGYTGASEEAHLAGTDDFQEWNVGADLDIGAFGLGAVYTENNNSSSTEDDNETWVVGADYTTGPFKIGASYLNNDSDLGAQDPETDRIAAGVIYTYGPGMTFRGSVGYTELDNRVATDVDATTVTVGTEINF